MVDKLIAKRYHVSWCRLKDRKRSFSKKPTRGFWDSATMRNSML